MSQDTEGKKQSQAACSTSRRSGCRTHSFLFYLLAAGGVLGGLPSATSAQPPALRPLRDALTIGATELEVRPEQLALRRQAIEEALKQLETLHDWYEALVLPDWKDTPRNLAADEKLFQLDRELHQKVKDHLVAAVRRSRQDPAAREGLAVFLAQIGLALRSGTVSEPFQILRELFPDVLALTEDPAPAVRAAAAGALSKISPVDPGEEAAPGAVPPRLQAARAALTRLLTRDDLTPRRAAAAALSDFIQTMIDLEKIEISQVSRGKEPFPKPPRLTVGSLGVGPREVVLTAQEMVRLAGQGAADPDPQVRFHCLRAIFLAGSELEKMIPLASDYFKDQLRQPPFPPFLFTKKGRPRPDSPLGKRVLALRQRLQNDLRVYQPLVDVLGAQGALLARHLDDPDQETRLLTFRTLEMLAGCRLRIQRLWEWLPPLAEDELPSGEVGLPPPPGDESEQTAPLLRGLTLARDRLAQGVRDREPPVRLAALEFLEMLGRQAEPAVPTLVAALADPEPFIRWTAARALTHVAPARPAEVVPALARALNDPDPDARVAVIEALEEYGRMAHLLAPELPDLSRQVQEALAEHAVPALARISQQGDSEARMAAVRALAHAGAGNAERAVSALVAALSSADVRVRRSAADALGRLAAPAAQQALPALEKALHDPDEEVRRLASAALLTIRQRPH
jgi:HEAT repeat protein